MPLQCAESFGDNRSEFEERVNSSTTVRKHMTDNDFLRHPPRKIRRREQMSPDTGRRAGLRGDRLGGEKYQDQRE